MQNVCSNLLYPLISFVILIASSTKAQTVAYSADMKESIDRQIKKNSSTTAFEENAGQLKDQHNRARNDVRFYGNTQGMDYYIRDNGMSYQLSSVVSWKEQEDGCFKIPNSEMFLVPSEINTYRVDVNWLGINQEHSIEKGHQAARLYQLLQCA
jgi:hypothetical protein